MLNRVRLGVNLFILFLFSVAILYGIVILVINIFAPKNINDSTDINKQNVEIYVNSDKLIKDYNKFFNVENIIKSFVKDLNEKKYSEVYETFSEKYKSKLTKKEFLDRVENYLNANFKYETTMIDEIGYYNNKNLKFLYQVEKDEYIAVVKSLNETKETKIGIKIIDNQSYSITYLDL
jgi:hypothetical protein